MLPRVFASGDRGSMLPLFVGLLAVGMVLSLGAAEVCSSFTFREALQQYADQLSLIAVKERIQNPNDALSKLRTITDRFTLANFQVTDGQTAEIQLCGDWQGWLKLPGLNAKKTLCARSAAR